MSTVLGAGGVLSTDVDVFLDYNAAYTVAGWFWVNSGADITGTEVFFATDEGSEYLDRVYLNASSQLSIQTTGFYITLIDELPVEVPIDESDESASVVGTNAWHYLALVRPSGTELVLYLDGVEIAALESDAAIERPDVTGLYMGAAMAAGRLIYLRAWERALSVAELDYEMRSRSSVSEDDLFSDWPLTIHTDLRDHWGAADLTAGGTPSTNASTPLPFRAAVLGTDNVIAVKHWPHLAPFMEL
jgi:hypothetical protein